MVGPNGLASLATHKVALPRRIEDGGSLLAIGLDETELAALLPKPPRTRTTEHIAAFFEPRGVGSLLAGIGPADVQNRDQPRDALISEGADLVGDGVLAVPPGSRVVFCHAVPWQFGAAVTAGISHSRHRVSPRGRQQQDRPLSRSGRGMG